MNKIIYVDENAKKELNALEEIVQIEFYSQFKVLEEEGRLDYPTAKKIEKNLFEIRIRIQGSYRGFYAYIQDEYIVILHIFQKKTQKTPLKNIKLAKRRLKQYE